MDGREETREPASSASLQGIPAHVARCLVAVMEVARNPEATRDAESERAVRASAAEVIQAARAVQAWAESVETAGTRALLRSVEEDCAINLGQCEPSSSRRTRLREARRATVAELGVLTGLPQTQCQERVALASATVARGGYLRQRMEGGTVSAYRAITLHKETSHLDPLTADDIARRALMPLDGEPTSRDEPGSARAEIEVVAGQLPLSQGTFRRRLKRQLTKAESAAGVVERKTAEHEDARDVRTDDGNFGMATTWIEATRDRAYAAQQRIDAIARSARQAGDERTLRQLRSDVATDLLLHGSVPGDQILGAPPAARLNVYVGLATLLPDVEAVPAGRGVRTRADTHDSDAPGEVPGLGFLTPDQVRRIALTAGATWRRVVTDPVTGVAIEASQTYRPTQAMRELIVARDRTCRAPGCTIPARDADLDHDTPWVRDARSPAEGATHPDNLHALHRGHHHVKTRRWWHSQQGRHGVVDWITLTGQRVTTRPPGDDGVRIWTDTQSAPAETAVAEILDYELDPPPMLDSALAAMHVALSTRPVHVAR